MEVYNQAKSIGENFLQSFFSNTSPNVRLVLLKQAQGQFYGSDSLLSFESETFFGNQQIFEKLNQLPIKQSEVKVYDIQPSGNGILIYLSGLLVVEGETNPMNFVRVFFLAAANNSYYSNYNLTFLILVKNDIYKVTFA